VVKFGEERAEDWLIEEDNKLISNSVSALALDSNNMLWVGTHGGTHVIDPANPAGEWTKYQALRDTPNVPGGNWASTFVPVENGGMWIGFTNGNLSFYDGAGRWTVYRDSEYYMLRTLAIDPLGRVWVVKDNQPILVLENGEKVAEYTVADGLPEGRINTLYRDGDTLWIGGNGLYRFKDSKIEMVFNKDEMGTVVAITREADGNMLVARGNSLIRIGADGIPVVVLTGAFDSQVFDVFTSIYSLALDANGSIFLGTSNGLMISDDKGATWTKITTEGGITGNFLPWVLIDQYNTLWMGGNGLMRYIPFP
jgi:ligand-binding sensor domain-containing protein